MDIKIDVQGLNDLIAADRGLRALAEELEGNFAANTVNAIGKHGALRARENAPVLKYRLRPAIVAHPAKQIADGAEGTIEVAELIHWARIMHEHLQPWGPKRIVAKDGRILYQLGRVSRTMPGTFEGGVGGAFITRVFKVHTIQYERQIADVLTSLITTGRLQKYHFTP